MMDIQEQRSWLKKYLARIVCTLCAFLLALLIITLGVEKTVFVVAITVAGYFVGRLLDDKDTLRRIVNTYLGRS